MNEGVIVGLDIGGTKSSVVIGAKTADIVWKKKIATEPERGFQAVFAGLCGLVDEAMARGNPAAIGDVAALCAALDQGGFLPDVSGRLG